MSTTTDNNAALILAGNGYELSIAPDANEKKTELLATSTRVKVVTDNDQSADAQVVVRQLAAMRNLVEKSRKAVKEPVIEVGKKIDGMAKDFLKDIETEENRIRGLIGNHAAEVAKARAEKEAEERRAFESARAAREAAEAAALAAEEASSKQLTIAEIAAARVAAKEAEAERQETLALRMDASAAVIDTKVADGVRFAWDFEVTNLEVLARTCLDLVTIEPKRSAILAELKSMDEADGDAVAWAQRIGIRAFKKPVVSSR
jgi:hypothetical protein